MTLRFRIASVSLFALVLTTGSPQSAIAQKNIAPNGEYDLVVYGGTSAGVIAAVQAKKMGKSAIIVCPEKHLGGLTAGGLGFTDTGNKAVIGGLSREFYHRVFKKYQSDDAWVWQKREEYGNKGQGTPAIDGAERTMWIFEPRVAEAVYEDFVREHKIPVQRDEWLNREPGQGVKKTSERIESITMLSGKTYRGKMFIDATYEGDLMAAAGVKYHVGREANSVYKENWNGIQVGVLHHGHWFKKPVDPYMVPGDPKSGLLPRISSEPPGEKGKGDKRIQAYCFRMCLTNHPENRVPFPKPENYDAKQYELLLRVFDSGWREVFNKFDPIPNKKTDTNNHGPFSTDNIGYNYDYPEGSYEKRKEIIKEHKDYQQGLMYFIANDPRVPADIREKMATWGLAKDEFQDHGNWPHQIYVREARRMIGRYVMTEHDCLDTKETPDSVGMGSYTMDSHNVQRYVKPDGYVQNEGDIGVSPPRPYEIAYGSLVPKKSECENLLVPVCVSSSHIAFGSIRMEPVFMILGQSAATAAVLSLDQGLAVQDLPYDKLKEQLLKDGQILESTHSASVSVRDLKGVVVDDRQANLTGNWGHSTALGKFVAAGYRHDGDENKGEKSAEFSAELKPGRYHIRIIYSAGSNRATNVPISIEHEGGISQVSLNQKLEPPEDGLAKTVGTYSFGKSARVVITNKDTDGHVIVDAVQFLPAKSTDAEAAIKNKTLYSKETKEAVSAFDEMMRGTKAEWEELILLMHADPRRYAFLMTELNQWQKQHPDLSNPYGRFTDYLHRRTEESQEFAKRSARAWKRGWGMTSADMLPKLSIEGFPSTRRIAIEFLKMENNEETFGYEWKLEPDDDDPAVQKWKDWIEQQDMKQNKDDEE